MGDSGAHSARSVWRLAGDATAVAVLLGVFLYLPREDGGFLQGSLRPFVWLLVVALPVAIAEIPRLPRRVGLLVAAWPAGAVLALAFGLDRSGFVQPAVTYSLIIVVGLLAGRVWKRRWGPVVLLVTLLGSFGLSWYEGFIAWYGTTISNEVADKWLSLSWHNQSAALMAAGGVGFAGVAAVVDNRVVRAALSLVSGAGLAAVWLTGSRGGLLVGLVGLAVVVIGGRMNRRGLMTALTAAAVVALALTLALQSTGPGDGLSEAPLTQRQETASGSVQWRLQHWEAALRMAAERPLTGWGLGAFAATGARYADPSVSLTTSAHNEYLEGFAEGGLALSIPLAAVAIGLVVAIGTRARRPEALDPGNPWRAPLLLGSVGTLTVLVLHAAIDFDWLYPLLAAHFGLAAAVTLSGPSPETPDRRLSALWGIPLALLALIGAGGLWLELNGIPGASTDTAAHTVDAILWWDAASARVEVSTLLADGDLPLAQKLLDKARPWNPGDPDLATMESIVAYRRGTASAADLVETLDPEHPRFAAYNLVAATLLDAGDVEPARRLLEQVVAIYPEYAARSPQSSATQSWGLLVYATGLSEGCDAAQSVAGRAAADPIVGPVVDYSGVADQFCDQ